MNGYLISRINLKVNKTYVNGKITELEQAISLLKTENSKQKIDSLESNSVSNDNNNTSNNTNSSGWAAIGC